MARTLAQIQKEMNTAKKNMNSAAKKGRLTLAAQYEAQYGKLSKEYTSMEKAIAKQNADAKKIAQQKKATPAKITIASADSLADVINKGLQGNKSTPTTTAKLPTTTTAKANNAVNVKQTVSAPSMIALRDAATKQLANTPAKKLTVVQPEGEWKSMGNAGGRPVETPAKAAAPATPAAPAQETNPEAAYDTFGLTRPTETRDYYTKQAADYANRQTQLANQQINSRNSAFDKQQNENYINYMMSQKALPEQLARLGLSGGASETSQLRSNMNYANQRGATNLNRNAEIAAINTNLQNLIAANDAQQNAAMRDELTKNKSELYNRKNAKEISDRDFDFLNKQYDEGVRQFNITNTENARQFDADLGLRQDQLAEEKRGNLVTEQQNAAAQAETKRMNDEEIKFKEQELALQAAAQDLSKRDGDFDKAKSLAETYGTEKKCRQVIKYLSGVKKPTTYQKYLLGWTRARLSEIQGNKQQANQQKRDTIEIANKTKK